MCGVAAINGANITNESQHILLDAVVRVCSVHDIAVELVAGAELKSSAKWNSSNHIHCTLQIHTWTEYIA